MPWRNASCALAAAMVFAYAASAPVPCQAVTDVRHFLSNPDGSGARLSPNGLHVALITTVEGHDVILVWDLDSDKRRSILKFPDVKAQLKWLEWASDNRLIFGVDVPLVWSTGVRARSSLLYGIDRDGDNLKHLGGKWFGRGDRSKTYRKGEELTTVPIQFEDRIVSMLLDDDDHVLVAIIRPGKRHPGVYRVNVHSGRLRRIVAPQDRVSTWVADYDGIVRVGYGGFGDKSWVIARTSADEKFVRINERTLFESPIFAPLGFSFQPTMIYVVSNHGGDRDAVYEFALDTRTFGKKVYEHARVDVGDQLYFDRLRKVITGIGYTDDRPEVHFLDETAKKEQAAIDRALPGRTNRITSRSRDHRRVLIQSSSDTNPPTTYLFDRDKRAMDELFNAHPKLAPGKLAPMKSVSYEARDGRTIPAYLTLPQGSGGAVVPVVVMPHGGPTLRDSIHFQGDVQFLASRGYAVFQPNFRGSRGFGSSHESSGYQQWGLAMQDDITDGVRWLIAQGIADAKRICIFGASYGGYAALQGLVKEPELFRCGASLAGVTDLITLLNDDDWYVGTEDDNVPKIGSTWSDRDKLKAASPARNVDKIRAPVLIAHGEADSIVHIKHAKAFVDAMKNADKTVELMVFEDETHGLGNEKYRIEFYTKLAEFLAKHLQ